MTPATKRDTKPSFEGTRSTSELSTIRHDTHPRPSGPRPTANRRTKDELVGPSRPARAGGGGGRPMANQLPPGWERRWDHANSREYFVDHNTQTSHFELPQTAQMGGSTLQHTAMRPLGGTGRMTVTCPMGMQAGQLLQVDPGAGRGHVQVTIPAGISQGQTFEIVLPTTMGQTVPGPAGATSMNHLPPGWQQLQDPHGRDYFVNESTGQTQWEPPVAHQTVMQPTTMPDKAGLPAGWEKRVDAASGRAYYVDHNGSGRTQWEPPTQPSIAPSTVGAPSHPMQPTTMPDTATNSVAAGLPAGWEQRIDAASGRPYYVDQNGGGRTQWEPPTHPSTEPESGLPAGWEQRIDAASGKEYYVDHNSGQTQWEPPASTMTFSLENPPGVWQEHPSDVCELLEVSMGYQLDGGRLQLPDARFEVRWGNAIAGPAPPSGMVQVDLATHSMFAVRRNGPTNPSKPWLRPGQDGQPAPWEPAPILGTGAGGGGGVGWPQPTNNSELPPGWQQHFAEDGRPFYVSPSGQTQWDPPIEVSGSMIEHPTDASRDQMSTAGVAGLQSPPPPPFQRYQVTVPAGVYSNGEIMISLPADGSRSGVMLRVPAGLAPGQIFELDFESAYILLLTRK
eukprot:SAG31_NODE_373_length_16597_cov_21.519518_19_plen_620_part_00